MIRLIAILCCLSLAACGGSRYSSANAARTAVPSQSTALFATGPIYSACMASRRKAASRSQCGCVQAVADRSLSAAEQRRGAAFFSDPHSAQEVRQSDNASNERFWKRWKAYGGHALKQCGKT